MELFDGKKHAELLDEKIRLFLQNTKNKQNLGLLAIIQIGDDSASTKYVGIKQRFCEKMGIQVKVVNFPSDVAVEELKNQIRTIVAYSAVKSVIIQLPLPRPELNSLLDLIPPEKDVDLLSQSARDKYFSGDFSILPPAVRAVKLFLETYSLNLAQKQVAIVGCGFLIGQPLKKFFESFDAKVNCYGRSNNVSNLLFKEELIILASGIPDLLNGKNISPGAFVIDFGFPGDLDTKSASIDHLAVLSASTGGMGPLVVRYLVMNNLGI